MQGEAIERRKQAEQMPETPASTPGSLLDVDVSDEDVTQVIKMTDIEGAEEETQEPEEPIQEPEEPAAEPEEPATLTPEPEESAAEEPTPEEPAAQITEPEEPAPKPARKPRVPRVFPNISRPGDLSPSHISIEKLMEVDGQPIIAEHRGSESGPLPRLPEQEPIAEESPIHAQLPTADSRQPDTPGSLEEEIKRVDQRNLPTIRAPAYRVNLRPLYAELAAVWQSIGKARQNIADYVQEGLASAQKGVQGGVQRAQKGIQDGVQRVQDGVEGIQDYGREKIQQVKVSYRQKSLKKIPKPKIKKIRTPEEKAALIRFKQNLVMLTAAVAVAGIYVVDNMERVEQSETRGLNPPTEHVAPKPKKPKAQKQDYVRIPAPVAVPEPTPAPAPAPAPQPVPEPEPIAEQKTLYTPGPEQIAEQEHIVEEPIVEEIPIAIARDIPTTLPEPIVEEEPEPVFEEYLGPIAEEEPEPEPAAVPEPVVEEEPEPVIEEFAAPVAEEEPAPEPIDKQALPIQAPAPTPAPEPEPIDEQEPEPAAPSGNWENLCRLAAWQSIVRVVLPEHDSRNKKYNSSEGHTNQVVINAGYDLTDDTWTGGNEWFAARSGRSFPDLTGANRGVNSRGDLFTPEDIDPHGVDPDVVPSCARPAAGQARHQQSSSENNKSNYAANVQQSSNQPQSDSYDDNPDDNNDYSASAGKNNDFETRKAARKTKKKQRYEAKVAKRKQARNKAIAAAKKAKETKESNTDYAHNIKPVSNNRPTIVYTAEDAAKSNLYNGTIILEIESRRMYDTVNNAVFASHSHDIPTSKPTKYDALAMIFQAQDNVTDLEERLKYADHASKALGMRDNREVRQNLRSARKRISGYKKSLEKAENRINTASQTRTENNSADNISDLTENNVASTEQRPTEQRPAESYNKDLEAYRSLACDAYLDEKLPVREIANHLDISTTTAYKRIKEQNPDAIALRKQERDEERQQNMEYAWLRRQEGATYKQIGEELKETTGIGSPSTASRYVKKTDKQKKTAKIAADNIEKRLAA
jgi:transposase